MTYSQLIETAPDCLAIVAVTERGEKGIANDFLILDTDQQKSEALSSLAYFKEMGFEADLIATYVNKSVSVVRVKDSEPTFEPILTPAEEASFLRNYFGLPQ